MIKVMCHLRYHLRLQTSARPDTASGKTPGPPSVNQQQTRALFCNYQQTNTHKLKCRRRRPQSQVYPIRKPNRTSSGNTERLDAWLQKSGHKRVRGKRLLAQLAHATGLTTDPDTLLGEAGRMDRETVPSLLPSPGRTSRSRPARTVYLALQLPFCYATESSCSCIAQRADAPLGMFMYDVDAAPTSIFASLCGRLLAIRCVRKHSSRNS